MADGTAVPWEVCADTACAGARLAGGRCAAHTPAEELAADLRAVGPVPDLDARGVRFTPAAVGRLLEALPVDDEGCLLLGSVRLDDATFEQAVTFDGASFAGDVTMSGCTFCGDARFGGATFSGAVDCRGATFGGQAWFVGATFAAGAAFDGARFDGAAWFQRASFAGPATFDGAFFATSVTIADARFDDLASFVGVDFDGHVRTDRASCAVPWRLGGTRFRYGHEGPQFVVTPRSLGPGSAPSRPDDPSRRPGSGRRDLGRRLLPWVVPVAVFAAIAVLGLVLFRPMPDAPDGLQAEVTGSAHVDFLHRQLKTNQVTRYNPCEPLRFVVNHRSAPPGWIEELLEVVDEVSSLTGITFVLEGTTDESIRLDVERDLKRAYGWPRDVEGYSKGYQDLFNRPSYQPERYGEGRWAPVLIGWTSFGEVDAGFGKHLAGVGASEPREHAGGTTFVSGTLLLNSDTGMTDFRTTLMHELGHVLGLAHVGSPDEIMYPRSGVRAEWGRGDVEGLKAVGLEAGCTETPSP